MGKKMSQLTLSDRQDHNAIQGKSSEVTWLLVEESSHDLDNDRPNSARGLIERGWSPKLTGFMCVEFLN